VVKLFTSDAPLPGSLSPEIHIFCNFSEKYNHMKYYNVYLFDFDYTLADSSKGIVMCFRHVLKLHGYMEISDMEIKYTIGRTLEDAFSVLTGISDRETLLSYKKEYVEKANDYMTQNTTLYPETINVLTTLKKRGAKVGIISTKFRYRILDLMDQKFPADFFDIVVGGEDVKAAKPSPEGVFYAIEKLNTEKQDVLYIGDSEIDAQTAEAAGVDFLGVLHGTTTHDELSVYPHIKIANDLNELIYTDLSMLSI